MIAIAASWPGCSHGLKAEIRVGQLYHVHDLLHEAHISNPVDFPIRSQVRVYHYITSYVPHHSSIPFQF